MVESRSVPRPLCDESETLGFHVGYQGHVETLLGGISRIREPQKVGQQEGKTTTVDSDISNMFKPTNLY